MKSNQVWELVDLLKGHKAIGNKWILKIKCKANGVSICPRSQSYDFRITTNMIGTYKVKHKNELKLELK